MPLYPTPYRDEYATLRSVVEGGGDGPRLTLPRPSVNLRFSARLCAEEELQVEVALA